MPAPGDLQTKSSINRETKASEDSSQDVLLNGRCCRHLFQLREKWEETYPKYFNKRELAEQPSLAGDQFYALVEKKIPNQKPLYKNKVIKVGKVLYDQGVQQLTQDYLAHH